MIHNPRCSTCYDLPTCNHKSLYVNGIANLQMIFLNPFFLIDICLDTRLQVLFAKKAHFHLKNANTECWIDTACIGCYERNILDVSDYTCHQLQDMTRTTGPCHPSWIINRAFRAQSRHPGQQLYMMAMSPLCLFVA